MSRCRNLHLRVGTSLFLAALALGGGATAAESQIPPAKRKITPKIKVPIPLEEQLSSGGMNAAFGPDMAISSEGEAKRGGHDRGRGGNTFVNDPCLDPAPGEVFPANFFRTVQSETEIAVLNTRGSMGKKMVAGYNDSFGFYNNTQGLSGFAYSVDGGNKWIDGGGLPPVVRSGAPAGTPGSDAYFGDPVVVVHQATQTFFYSSIYMNPAGQFTLSVNRGSFQNAPPQGVESISNTRCANDPTEFGVPDPPPPNQDERIIWELPVEAVLQGFIRCSPDPLIGCDFLDKEWLYVDQNTGILYLTYTRFGFDGTTPIELVRSFDGGRTWTPPSIIVPNLIDTFNQATQAFTTPTGRVIVTWHARTFPEPDFIETEQRIEIAFSDNCSTPTGACTFGPPVVVSVVNPQGEPPGYNRARPTILNAPYIFVDRGSDDGVFTAQERAQPGFGNVYIAYFSGKRPFGSIIRAADIFLSTSTNNGTSFGPPVKVNDDNTNTVHVFPSVQANKHGDVYVAWIDRRQDPPVPADPTTTPPTPASGNVFNDTYAAVSKNFGASFGHNKLQTTVSTTWFTREDARPDYGDYNSSELLGFNQFVTIWADGRFPVGTGVITPAGNTRSLGTPDVIFTIAQGLGIGGGGSE